MSNPSHIRKTVAVIVATGILLLVGGSAATAAYLGPTRELSTFGDGPQFYTGADIDISGDVDGDVYASGQTITVSGNITGDVIAAAQTITITGNVDGNVRVTGQDVSVSGDVSRSGTVFAARVTVTDTGSFGKDIVGAAGDIRISGEIGRNLKASVGNLTIDGAVKGNVSYQSDTAARIADGAVGGTVEQVETPSSPEVGVSPWALFVGWVLVLLYALVSLSLVTVAVALLVPRQLHRVTDQLVPSPWKALLVGFLACLIVPIAIFAGLVSIIGAPLALAALFVWLVLLFATFVYGAHYIGRLLFRGDQHPVVMALVGGVILIVALNVPWLNIVVWAAMLFFGVGAQLLDIYDRRPWRRVRPGTVGVSEPAALD